MTRKDFIKLCGFFGLSIPFQSTLYACGEDDSIGQFSGKVLIVGAGAGGLSAGYYLQQRGIDFEILEAGPNYGGRMRVDTNFADFPIPLGAEWIETETTVFQTIVNNSATKPSLETIEDEEDFKFVNYSWYQFFSDYIVPAIAHKIRFNTVVHTVDYSATQAVLATQSGNYVADKVIMAVPLKALQRRSIQFVPELPTLQWQAIADAPIWDGFKAFFQFSSKFYADEYRFPVARPGVGEMIFYDAAFGQKSAQHILGVFAVGEPALAYTSLSDTDLQRSLLHELDTLYEGKATIHYQKHIVQNWIKEAYIWAGYLSDKADWKLVKQIGAPVGDRLYFAGGEYTDGENWVSVHVAAASAKRCVEVLLGE